jgi:hypothetical protein
MKRRLAVVSSLLAVALTGYSATELPENDDYQSFEIEPPILLPNRQIDSGKSEVEPGRSNRDPIELEKQVERAKRTAADAELLFKRGVLSRMEVELRALRIVRLQADLEAARFERARADLAIQQTRLEMGEITKDDLAAIQRNLQIAREKADAAAAAWDRAEMAAAETNLRRQQKLAALGYARPADVARAQQKLADLKAAKN